MFQCFILSFRVEFVILLQQRHRSQVEGHEMKRGTRQEKKEIKMLMSKNLKLLFALWQANEQMVRHVLLHLERMLCQMFSSNSESPTNASHVRPVASCLQSYKSTFSVASSIFFSLKVAFSLRQLKKRFMFNVNFFSRNEFEQHAFVSVVSAITYT